MRNQTYEIGSNFHLSNNEILTIENLSEPTEIQDSEKQKYLSSGRQAICACLTDIENNQNVNKVALVPAYTCQSVLAGFLEKGYHLCFYSIDRQFQVKTSTLNNLIKKLNPDVLLFHPYFGFDTIIQDQLLDKQSTLVIYDATQSWASGFEYSFADYRIVSLRKWTALPDGAIAEKISGDFGTLWIEQEQENLINDTLTVYDLKEKYLRYQKGEKSEMLQGFINLKQTFFDEKYTLYTMANFSRKVLENFTAETVLENWQMQRRENYKALYNYENWEKIGTPYFELAEGVIPLYFPINVENMTRRDVQKYLATNNVYCPIIWPIPQNAEIKPVTNELTEIRNNCLCIPIDQRYSEKDMEYILEIIDKLNID
ncbi:MAG TPA: hypothetical protein GXZ43_00825 [Clostridiaceae bacterium]|nr:hypothetical protein [Clostridiaceae bacterium]